MNLEEALAMTQRFPEDKTVPEKLSKAIRESSGELQEDLRQLAEGLILDAVTPQDRRLVSKHLF